MSPIDVSSGSSRAELSFFGVPTYRAWFVVLIVGGVLLALYLSRLAPTVGAGDTADLQAQTALLGIAHPPGYILQIFAGKLFLLVTPAWGDVAYRLNVFTALCGVAGCLLFYAAIYNITKDIVAACWGALVLGLSSIYWKNATVTEVYVFHSLFIVLTILFLTEHFRSGRLRYLYCACFSLGIAVAGRASEIFIIPAFIPAFALAYRGLESRVTKLVVSLSLFLVPFVFSVGYYLAFHNTGLLLSEDQQAIEGVIERAQGGDGQGKSLSEALQYCLALKWIDRPPQVRDLIEHANRYLNLLIGRPEARPRLSAARGLRNGTSVGVVALTLAAGALLLPRGPWRWLLCGLGMFIGNFMFFLWHPRWDGLTFVIPSILGLSLLAAIGAHEIGSTRKGLRVGLVMLLIVSASSLYLENRQIADRSSSAAPSRTQMSAEDVRQFPPRSILVAGYWTAMTYRYIVQVVADRHDITVVKMEASDNASLIQKLASTGRPVFVNGGRGKTYDRNDTPAVLRKYNFWRVRHDSGAESDVEE